MANVVSVIVENADQLLNASMYGAGAIVRLQSSSDGVTYANETTAALVSGTRLYTLYDTDGTSSTWYRTRYENAGGTSTSDWSDPFVVGGETGGYLCSLYDVEQRLAGVASTNDREQLLEIISQVSAEITGYTGRTLLPETATYRFDALVGQTLDRSLRTLWVDRGIRSITSLSIAADDQPDTGGTFTTLAATEYSLRPSTIAREPGWPATSVVILPTSSSWFTPGINTVEIAGAFGFAAVPPDVQAVAENATIRRYQARGSGVATALGTEDFGARLLRWISPEERMTLERYRRRWIV